MREVTESDLSEISPFDDANVPAALSRILESPVAERVRALYFPILNPEEFRAKISKITTSARFQKEIVAPAIDAMLLQSSDGFSASGLERNPPDRRYTFVSNHRDILCDPALFTYFLVRQGWDAPLICLGDNLLVAPWITDLIKINRGVTVKRNLSQRELLKWSHALSEVLSRAVKSGQASVWIAQREGRAKDGDDATHSGVIKMLSLASHAMATDASLIGQIDSLHLVPVAISYEYDPTDAMKARELHLGSQPGGHKKQAGEDLRSMVLGLQGEKGRVHLEIGVEIKEAIERARKLESRKDQVALVASEIDRQIQLGYRLWPTHYIAFDLLEGQDRFAGHQYSPEEKARFIERMESQLASLQEADLTEIRRWFLRMYAKPVENQLARIQSAASGKALPGR